MKECEQALCVCDGWMDGWMDGGWMGWMEEGLIGGLDARMYVLMDG